MVIMKSKRIKFTVEICIAVLLLLFAGSDACLELLDSVLLPEKMNPGYFQLTGTSAKKKVLKKALVEDNPNLLINSITPYKDPAGFSVDVRANGAVSVEGANNTESDAIVRIAGDLDLPTGDYIISDGEVSKDGEAYLCASVNSYAIGGMEEEKIIALPDQNQFRWEDSDNNKLSLQIVLPPYYATAGITFFPMLRKKTDADIAYFPCVAQNPTVEKNDEVYSYNQYYLDTLSLASMTKTDWKLFYRYLSYTVNWKKYNWLTLRCSDGNGFYFSGKKTGDAIYGKLDAVGRVSDQICDLSLTSEGNWILNKSYQSSIRTLEDIFNKNQTPLNQIDDLYSYLIRLKSLLENESQYSIIVSVRDEGTSMLDEVLMKGLHDIGISTALTDGHKGIFTQGRYNGLSYYAVLTSSEVSEQSSSDVLLSSGNLSDQSPYYVISGGRYSAQQVSSIVISGQEESMNHRGMNFVVYNNDTHKVEDSVCFDTFEGLECYR